MLILEPEKKNTLILWILRHIDICPLRHYVSLISTRIMTCNEGSFSSFLATVHEGPLWQVPVRDGLPREGHGLGGGRAVVIAVM